MPRPPDISHEAQKGLHNLRAEIRADLEESVTIEETLNAVLEHGIENGTVRDDAMSQIKRAVSDNPDQFPGSR